jgi:single-stranded-DNA-specific exonuclease
MRQRRNVGLRALADAAGLAVPPTPYHLGFVLGPRINAGGRIGDAGLGARLLATADKVDAARIAELLDRLNRERKALEARILEEAVARAETMLETDPDLPMLLLAGEGWHKGVVGLVAGSPIASSAPPASSPGARPARARARCAQSTASTSARRCAPR